MPCRNAVNAILDIRLGTRFVLDGHFDSYCNCHPSFDAWPLMLVRSLILSLENSILRVFISNSDIFWNSFSYVPRPGFTDLRSILNLIVTSRTGWSGANMPCPEATYCPSLKDTNVFRSAFSGLKRPFPSSSTFLHFLRVFLLWIATPVIMSHGPNVSANWSVYVGLLDTSKPWWKNRRTHFPSSTRKNIWAHATD